MSKFFFFFFNSDCYSNGTSTLPVVINGTKVYWGSCKYDLKFEENSFSISYDGSRMGYTPVGVLRDMIMVNGDGGADEGKKKRIPLIHKGFPFHKVVILFSPKQWGKSL